MLPLLILGAAAAILVAHRRKISALWKSSFTESDFNLPSSDIFSGEDGPIAAAAMTPDALLKLSEKLDRQPVSLDEPLALVVLSTGNQAAFYEASAGGENKIVPSARTLICDALAFAEETYGGGELYLSPMKKSDGEVEWVAGFCITNGPAGPEDFEQGGALEGCILAGDLATLKQAGFC